MKIKVSNQPFEFVSDNSKECGANVAFVKTAMNEKYAHTLQEATPIVLPIDLKSMIDLTGLKIVGLTGTNGKTTTAAAIYSFLIDLGYKVALQGTRGFFVNDQKVEGKSLTTPLLLDNYGHMLYAKEMGCEFFIMEVSSHAIVQGRVEGIDFELKILTNITSDHLDFHKSWSEYKDVKNSFFDDESNKLINMDEKNAKYNYVNSISYAIESGAVSKIIAYSFANNQTSAIVQYFRESESFTSSMVGFFNLYNLLAAISATKMLTDRPLKEICDVVEDFGGVSGRVEVVSQEPLIIVDFAHTEDGMRKIFESFSDRKIITLFGAGGNRDKSKRPLMGKTAAEFARRIYITSDNPRDEEPEAIANDILSGIPKRERVIVELDRPKAIKRAIEELADDEILLILGKGDEETQEIKGVFYPMSDKQIVKSFL